MSITEKISHAAERKAFETILDSMLKKGQTQDVGDLAEQLIDMIQKIHKGTWSDKSYETLRMIAENPDGKWAHYTQRLIRENDPYILKTFLTNVAYEGGFRGYQTAQENAAKYDINVPWLILMDPTSACNMHCTGCWAAEYGHKQSLTFEEMDRVLTEAKELGTHACLFTGGEPLLRPDLPGLLRAIKDLGYAVKLDTNGSHPATLRSLVEEGLADYVAMDVKNSPEQYAATVGLPDFDLAPIRESVAYLLSGAVDYEFRTTAVAEFHNDASFRGIAQWIAGARRYYIQCFTDRDSVLQAGLHAPEKAQLEHWADIVRPLVPDVELRGV